MAQLVNVELKNIFIGRLDHGSDLIKELTQICVDNDISLGKVEAIGAVKNATLAYYNQNTKEYETYNFNKHLEILALVGNISLRDGKPLVHAHVTFSDDKGNVFGGHLLPGCEVFACEVTIQQYKGASLNRGLDEQTGLPLWDMV